MQMPVVLYQRHHFSSIVLDFGSAIHRQLLTKNKNKIKKYNIAIVSSASRIYILSIIVPTIMNGAKQPMANRYGNMILPISAPMRPNIILTDIVNVLGVNRSNIRKCSWRTTVHPYRSDVGKMFTMTPMNAVEQMLPSDTYTEDSTTVTVVPAAQYKPMPQPPTVARPPTITRFVPNHLISRPATT